MAAEAPLYDLVLLLSEGADEGRRAKILSDTEAAITTAGGSIERNDDWGRRPLAYQIGHQPEAEYHLLQFTAPGRLIDELSHTLRITDGVVRFRVIKVRPGTPEAPSSPPPVVAAATARASAGPSTASPGPSPAEEEAAEVPEQDEDSSAATSEGQDSAAE